LSFPLGIGWSANYFQLIQYTGDSSGRTGAYVFRPDGAMLFFAESAGVFACGCETADTLAWTYDGSGNKTGFLYTTASADLEQYNLSGQLQSISSRGGITQTLSYGTNGYLSSVADNFGHTLTFNWDSSAQRRISSIVDPAGATISYGYDNNDNLKSVTYQDSKQITYLYELTGSQQINLLTGRTDETTTRFATWGYTGSQVTSSQHAGGVDSYTFTYNSDGSRTVVDPLGTSRTYTTAFVGGQRRYTGVNTVCAGCGELKSVAYDVNGNVAWKTDFNNNETSFAFDLTRNLESLRTEAFGTSFARTITTTWNAAFALPATITEPNRTTTFQYDAMANVLTKTITDTTVTPNVTRTWTYTYDSYGRLKTSQGPRTDVNSTTTYTYYTCTTGYQCGQVQTITDPVGNVNDLQYLQRSRPTTHDHRSERHRDNARLRQSVATDRSLQ
jgi:YD repeat-containing protein